jgi:hypothetical protein
VRIRSAGVGQRLGRKTNPWAPLWRWGSRPVSREQLRFGFAPSDRNFDSSKSRLDDNEFALELRIGLADVEGARKCLESC